MADAEAAEAAEREEGVEVFFGDAESPRGPLALRGLGHPVPGFLQVPEYLPGVPDELVDVLPLVVPEAV